MADLVDLIAEHEGRFLSYAELSELAGRDISSQNVWRVKRRLEQRHGLTLVNHVNTGYAVAPMADPPELDRRRGVGRPWRLGEPRKMV